MSAGSVPAPPSPLPLANFHILPAKTVLHRTHSASYKAAEFNPGKGQDTRFAPFNDVTKALIPTVIPTVVPTLYAASNREAAAFESVFHDIAPTAAYKTVRQVEVEKRYVSEIAPRRDLALVQLFAPDLKAWGLGRNQLIDTSKSTYARTVLWAQAIHAQFTRADGLIWTSRQCDPQTCMVFFGDRIKEADFDMLSSRHIGSDPALLLEYRNFGLRAGITLI